jgi:lipid-A-disaccharide synthase
MVRRVMVIAGEPSGDLHGAGLVRELKVQAQRLDIFGVGGDQMAQAGADLIFHIKDLSFMGFAEVLKHLPAMRRVEKKLGNLLVNRKPDALVLIDYPGFNLRFAKIAKHHGVRIFYYISPQVWAWGRGRVQKMKGLIEKMFVVFPFEEEIYKKAGITVEFVGHPLLETLKDEGDGQFRARLGFNEGKKLLGLFPGSRLQEVHRIFPTMVRAAKEIQTEFDCEVGVGVSPNIDVGVYRSYLKSDSHFRLVEGATQELMKHSDLAFVTSGTATLETACFGTPMIVLYRTSVLTYWIARMLITLNSIALVNIVAGREIVPELVQGKLTVGNLVREGKRILSDASLATRMREELLAVRQKLGTPGASERVARSILSLA